MKENKESQPKPVKRHHYSAAMVVLIMTVAVLLGMVIFLWEENNTARTTTTSSGTTTVATNNTTSDSTSNAPSNSTNSTSNTTNTTTTTTSSNKYEGMKVKVGDKVAGMTVTHKEGSLSDSTAPVTKDIILVHFAGQTTVSGTYNYGKNEMTGAYELVFTVNNSDLSKIPYMTEKDSATKAFLIENEVYAYPLLGITHDKDKTGSAKIVIDGFYDVFVGAEVAPTASLLQVL